MKHQKYIFSFHFQGDTTGVILRETKTHYEIVSLLTYVWMNHLAFDNWQNIIQTKNIDKEMAILKKCPFDFEIEPWMLHFPIDEKTLLRFNDVSLFFETLLSKKHESITKKLEYTIDKMQGKLHQYRLKELVLFVYNQHKHHKERLRLLLSPKIMKYVR